MSISVASFWKNLKCRKELRFTNHIGYHCLSVFKITKGLGLTIFEKLAPVVPRTNLTKNRTESIL